MTDELTGKIIADKYRIDSLLRESDLGPIYRGWHVLMDKAVTIKILATALVQPPRSGRLRKQQGNCDSKHASSSSRFTPCEQYLSHPRRPSVRLKGQGFEKESPR